MGMGDNRTAREINPIPISVHPLSPKGTPFGARGG